MGTEPRRLTYDEFVALGKERFGDDPIRWGFQCPNCGDIATGGDIKAALDMFPRTRGGQPVQFGDVLGQECIGRLIGALGSGSGYSGRGCNWCAFGLLPAPWTIEMSDGKTVSAFPLAEGTATVVV